MNRTTLATLAFVLVGTFTAEAQMLHMPPQGTGYTPSIPGPADAARVQPPQSAMQGQDAPYTPQGTLSRPATGLPQTGGAILYDKSGKPVFKDMTRADCGNLDSQYSILSREEFAARSIYCDGRYKAEHSLSEKRGTQEQ